MEVGWSSCRSKRPLTAKSECSLEEWVLEWKSSPGDPIARGIVDSVCSSDVVRTGKLLTAVSECSSGLIP
jgi:hypothetical protein